MRVRWARAPLARPPRAGLLRWAKATFDAGQGSSVDKSECPRLGHLVCKVIPCEPGRPGVAEGDAQRRREPKARAKVPRVREPDGVFDPAALTGAMVAGGFGIAWTLWGGSGLAGAAAVAVRVGGIVIGALILVSSVRLQRRARRAIGVGRRAAPGDRSGSIFASRGYRLTVALEVIALFAGGALLGATGHREYTIAWFAAVVGVHFVAFGRLFWTGFYLLGVALLAAGVAGAVVGLAGAGSDTIRAVSGLIAAASLFAAGGWTVTMSRASLRD